MYDVTRAESFESLEKIWMKEVDIYSNIEDAVKMVVANKVDLVSGSVGRSGDWAEFYSAAGVTRETRRNFSYHSRCCCTSVHVLWAAAH